MTIRIGQVEALFRYPVKSMRGDLGITITVVQANGDCFKTLAKNAVVRP